MSFKRWLVGFLEAFFSGGTTALSTNWVDPNDFNVYTRKFWLVVLASAAMSAVKYARRTMAKYTQETDEKDTRTPVTGDTPTIH